MRIRIIGGGFYGCHLAVALKRHGFYVEVHEVKSHIFGGASGGIPARLHMGFHYPRSRVTRAACLEHNEQFLNAYGHITRGIETNIYAIAENDSMVDYAQYVDTLRGEVDFIEIHDPQEFGLMNVEGALLTGERHIVTDDARNYFERTLSDNIRYNRDAGSIDDPNWDLTIDCTFCANESANIDRYEPCVVGLLKGPTNKAVTIMDGPFGSLYPWNEELGLSSISSAKWTPLSKICITYDEAQRVLDESTHDELMQRCSQMLDSIAYHYPILHYSHELVDYKTSIRAMPRSGADTRLVDVIQVGENALRVRAGKIDAVFQAQHIVEEWIDDNSY